MSPSNEHEEPEEVGVNKKLDYTPPILTILTMQEIKAKNIAVSEMICGCGILS